MMKGVTQTAGAAFGALLGAWGTCAHAQGIDLSLVDNFFGQEGRVLDKVDMTNFTPASLNREQLDECLSHFEGQKPEPIYNGDLGYLIQYADNISCEIMFSPEAAEMDGQYVLGPYRELTLRTEITDGDDSDVIRSQFSICSEKEGYTLTLQNHGSDVARNNYPVKEPGFDKVSISVAAHQAPYFDPSAFPYNQLFLESDDTRIWEQEIMSPATLQSSQWDTLTKNFEANMLAAQQHPAIQSGIKQVEAQMGYSFPPCLGMS